ncbi:MAG TPA: citryl-CoA lyase [Candidatus Sulfopaludibacter sp.]|nr:citryl-CoA lyase [Candidatus Sulfopaludibacter sp.]
MEPWRTAIATSDAESLRLRGYEITDLMKRSFTDTIFLLHQSRLPSPGEQRLLDAILVGGADHGAGAPSCAAARLVASGNRQSLSAAIAAGVLAIGEEHGGAGTRCMEMIGEGVGLAGRENVPLEEAARRIAEAARSEKRRIPGFGHRVHRTVDPRTALLFGMARESGVAGKGIQFIEALSDAVARQIRPLPVNIDGALAAVLFDMGLSPLLGNLIFIISRVAGLTAEVAEEYAREKAMRIHIPVSYDGPGPREIG